MSYQDVRNIRKELGLTQKAFAMLMRITLRGYQKIEREKEEILSASTANYIRLIYKEELEKRRGNREGNTSKKIANNQTFSEN